MDKMVSELSDIRQIKDSRCCMDQLVIYIAICRHHAILIQCLHIMSFQFQVEKHDDVIKWIICSLLAFCAGN